MLIVLGGLPGTGKTTIARLLAQRLNAVHLRIDTIEQGLRASGMLKSDVGPAGYVVAYRVAHDNLLLGKIVVADSVNPLAVTRDAWRSVGTTLSIPVVEVEVVCSDKAEHRRRVEARVADIDGLRQPSWQDVLDRNYERWQRQPITIDTAVRSAEQAVRVLVDSLDGRGLEQV